MDFSMSFKCARQWPSGGAGTVLLLLFCAASLSAAPTTTPSIDYQYQPKPTDVLGWNDTSPRPLFFKLGPYARPYLEQRLADWRKSRQPGRGGRGIAQDGFTSHAHWDRDYVQCYAIIYESLYDELTTDERQVFRRYLAERAYSVLDTDVTAVPVNMEVIDRIAVDGTFAVLFPQHPDHDRFRDAFLRATRFVDRHHIRPDVDGALGGRYMENIACYEPWAYGMRSMGAIGLYLNDPAADSQPNADLARWLFYRMNVLSPRLTGDVGGDDNSAGDGGIDTRVVPPQGAHAAAHGQMFVAQGNAYAGLMERYDPHLRDAYSWLYQDNGRWSASPDWKYDYRCIPPAPLEAMSDPQWKGARPNLKSEAFWDYGAIFRRDFGTLQEMSVIVSHVLSTNYRWGQNQAGLMYYFADGKAWSWNGEEDTGDNQASMKLGNQYCTAFATLHDDKPLMLGKSRAVDNLYDFGFAAQYTVPGNTDGYDPAGSNADYEDRSITLVGSDFVVIFDRVRSPDVPGDFRWFNKAAWGLPNIVQVKPGVPPVSVNNDYTDERNKTQTPRCNGVSFAGKGDFLTVVSHKSVTAVATGYGALVNGRCKIIYQASSADYQDGSDLFIGTAGYITDGKLALFDGTRIGTRGYTFDKPARHGKENNFGFSAQILNDQELSGDSSGAPGPLTIHFPSAPATAGKLFVNGREARFDTVGNSITFQLPNRPGANTIWQFTRKGPAPIPVRFLSEHAGDTKVRLAWTDGGDGATYEVQQSENWGPFVSSQLDVKSGDSAIISGLRNETPYVFRVRAHNGQEAGPWSEEFISIPTAKSPAAPAGLEALDYYNGEFFAPPVMGAGGVDHEPAMVQIRWGQVRGATTYTLQRKDGNGVWKMLVENLNIDSYDDHSAAAGQTYRYRVAAANLNGSGSWSREISVHRSVVAATVDADEATAIFAAAFTNITDSGALCVFSTKVPAKSVVSVTGDHQVIQTVSESTAGEIHQVALKGLEPNKTYQVTITVDGTKPAVLTLTTGQRPRRIDTFEGKTYFGIAHADDMEPLKELGAGLVRYSMTWDVLEPQRDQFDSSAIHKMVGDIAKLKAAGVEPLVLLCFSTEWAKRYTGRQMTWRNPAFGPPDSISDWKEYVRTVMTALKGQVRYYEIWNEPDAGYLATGAPIERTGAAVAESASGIFQKNDAYWLGNRYVPLVMAAREVADEVGGDHIDLLGPSWNHDYHGTRGELCFDHGLADYLQLYSFHNYVGDPHSYAFWESMTNDQYMVNADALFKKFNAPFPIAVTEWGVRTFDQPAAGGGFHSRRDGQIFIVKSVFDYLAMERVSILVLHQLGYNDEWSLVDKQPDGKLIYHPTFSTYRWICRAFNAKSYRKLSIATDAGPTARAFAVRLSESGAVYVALWQNPVLANDGITSVPVRSASVKLTGFPDGTYEMQQLDLDGNRTSARPIEAHNGIAWNQVLPEAGQTAESEPVICRLVPQ
jgi:Fibronectin type III domain